MTDDRHSGMTPRESWERTDVHRASTYHCAKCGKPFASPHDVYDHLDAEHPRHHRAKKEKKR